MGCEQRRRGQEPGRDRDDEIENAEHVPGPDEARGLARRRA